MYPMPNAPFYEIEKIIIFPAGIDEAIDHEETAHRCELPPEALRALLQVPQEDIDAGRLPRASRHVAIRPPLQEQQQNR